MKVLKQNNSGILKLLILNMIFFILIKISFIYLTVDESMFLLKNIWLNADLRIFLNKPWTIFTSMFTHYDFSHLFFNMFYLYWFGVILKNLTSNKSVITVYVLGGILGSLFYIIYYNLLNVDISNNVALGASAGVMSIMASATTLNPNHKESLLFIKVKIKWIFLFILITSTFLDFKVNTGGKIAHIGGVLFGFIYAFYFMQGIVIGKFFNNILEKFTNLFKRKNVKNIYNIEINTGFRGAMDRRDEDSILIAKKNKINRKKINIEIDFLLEKIKTEGYKSLTTEEKERLIKLSENFK